MANLDNYVEQKVDSICRWTNGGLRGAVITAMKEAMRDQSQGCAEAVKTTENPFRHYSAPRNKKTGRIISGERNRAREDESKDMSTFNYAKDKIYQAVFNAPSAALPSATQEEGSNG